MEMRRIEMAEFSSIVTTDSPIIFLTEKGHCQKSGSIRELKLFEGLLTFEMYVPGEKIYNMFFSYTKRPLINFWLSDKNVFIYDDNLLISIVTIA